ncbi:hypothetical protein U9M48_034537 [Paspalum notatum var. saurae]|uniref:Chromo domain-containing protein n=1 Tax=Paspalum notatum var. saurae TaxID=547442 RepID=A0AAQ3X742_PASNO
MLRAISLDLMESWDESLPLVKFAYNNSYQSSIKMAPYEALYGRRCRSPICWGETGERKMIGPDLVQQAEEKIQIIRTHLKSAQDRQKKQTDVRRRKLEFQVGDFVFLKVSPKKGTRRFGLRGKLSPRYVGPFQVVERVGPVAYRLNLPSDLSVVHNVFHVSLLRKCLREPIERAEIPLTELQPDLSYEEYATKILDTKERVMRQRTIRFLKVQWSNHTEEEATWEKEEDLYKSFPYLVESGAYVHHAPPRVVKKILRVVPRRLKQVAVAVEMFADLDTAKIEEVIGRLRIAEDVDKEDALEVTEGVGRLMLQQGWLGDCFSPRSGGRHGAGSGTRRGAAATRAEVAMVAMDDAAAAAKVEATAMDAATATMTQAASPRAPAGAEDVATVAGATNVVRSAILQSGAARRRRGGRRRCWRTAAMHRRSCEGLGQPCQA